MADLLQILEKKIALHKKFQEVYSAINEKDSIIKVVSALGVFLEKDLYYLDKDEKCKIIKDWLVTNIPAFSSRVNEIEETYNACLVLFRSRYSEIHKKTLGQYIKMFLSKKL